MFIGILKDKRGQEMVEFALCLPVFFAFVYGLIGLSLWGSASFFAQEAAHETARKYAVTLDQAQSQKLGKTYLGRWGYVFISESDIKLWDNGTIAYSEVIAKPRVSSLFCFSMPQIVKKSQATLENKFRNPGDYD